MPREKNDRTFSVRVPLGWPEQIRAATGQPVSRLVRTMLGVYIKKLEAERKPQVLAQNLTDAEDVAREMDNG